MIELAALNTKQHNIRVRMRARAHVYTCFTVSGFACLFCCRLPYVSSVLRCRFEDKEDKKSLCLKVYYSRNRIEKIYLKISECQWCYEPTMGKENFGIKLIYR